MNTRRSNEPSVEVLEAFGVAGADVQPLSGGQGQTWRASGVVLKPTGMPEETIWRAEVLASLTDSPDFRVARPVPTRNGEWMAYGWEAWTEVVGDTDTSRCDDVLQVSEAFHAAVKHAPFPEFLAQRDGPWTFGDRMAWDQLPVESDPAWLELLEPLAQARRPVELPEQPVHGDLLGNVLFADGMPPAVIDWPVYFRPPSWAMAVAAVDAITWYGAHGSLLDRWSGVLEWDQMLLRALIYRIATHEGRLRRRLSAGASPESYREAVRLVLDRVGG